MTLLWLTISVQQCPFTSINRPLIMVQTNEMALQPHSTTTNTKYYFIHPQSVMFLQDTYFDEVSSDVTTSNV